MTYDDPEDIIEEPFGLLLSRYHVGLETLIVLIYFIPNVIK